MYMLTALCLLVVSGGSTAGWSFFILPFEQELPPLRHRFLFDVLLVNHAIFARMIAQLNLLTTRYSSSPNKKERRYDSRADRSGVNEDDADGE